MARMIPRLDEQDLAALDPAAEAAVYRLLRDGLPDRVLVLHSVEWITRQTGQGAEDGEADFLICDPAAGLFVLEVKGGGVSVDPIADSWTSTDGRGQTHRIKDPFRQARSAKYAVLAKLKEHRRWAQTGVGKLLLGHAAAFPDLDDVSPLVTPRSPRAIIAGRPDLAGVAGWWAGLVQYWKNQDGALSPPGERVLHLVEEVFARPATARPLIAARLVRDEEVRLRLTDQQARILGLLGGRRRVAICGGAGTGKTLIAVEKARRLAAEGFRTLVVCYNRPLADSLARVCAGVPGLEVASFHALCAHRCELAKAAGRDLLAEAAEEQPGGDLYDVQMPLALAYSVDVTGSPYDAVVVDEGQDFREEYWLPIELLLADQDRSPLYVFYDQNQSLYSRATSFPVRDEPYVLTVNCRNTRAIHALSRQFFRGADFEGPDLEGLPVEVITAKTVSAQAWAIQKQLNRLLIEERVRPDDVAVLLTDAGDKETHYSALLPLPVPAGGTWLREDHHTPGGVLVETVHRFKGLEKPVIILWVGGTSTPQSCAEILYVGASRAKSLLYVIGPESNCGWAGGTLCR
jgi:hypothetical protein